MKTTIRFSGADECEDVEFDSEKLLEILQGLMEKVELLESKISIDDWDDTNVVLVEYWGEDAPDGVVIRTNPLHRGVFVTCVDRHGYFMDWANELEVPQLIKMLEDSIGNNADLNLGIDD